MRPRICLSRFLIRLGRFIESLAVVIMRPDDLVFFSRQAYKGSRCIEGWARGELIDLGLNSAEKALLDRIPLKAGRIVVLGVGGGREAIYFARCGFEVTGVDFVPEMAAKAIENASKRGYKINGIVQEISRLDIPDDSYDMVWLSAAMYSCVPTRARRVEMLKNISKILKPSGYFALQFQWNEGYKIVSKTGKLIKKIAALITLGNFRHEKGDMLWGNVEFIHAFSSEEEIKSEIRESNFNIEYISPREGAVCRREALLKKGV